MGGVTPFEVLGEQSRPDGRRPRVTAEIDEPVRSREMDRVALVLLAYFFQTTRAITGMLADASP
jgi:hypothetical protein